MRFLYARLLPALLAGTGGTLVLMVALGGFDWDRFQIGVIGAVVMFLALIPKDSDSRKKRCLVLIFVPISFLGLLVLAWRFAQNYSP